MRLTNALGLPAPVVAAIGNDGYSRGESDISVTQLIDSPRVVALTRRHWDEIEEDAADRVWSLIGQCVHTLLERADLEALTERRLTIERLGWRISGAFDRLAFTPDGLLQDYKVTSVWSVLHGGRASWEPQLNLYAHLAREHGFTVDRLEVVAILRDWRRNEARRSPDYPQKQVEVLPIPLWAPEEAEAYLVERVRLHQAARTRLPYCSAEDRWAKPDVWAVMKAGRKSAVKLCATEEEAKAVIGDPPAPGVSIVLRKGESVRCADYCAVAPFCRALHDGQHDGATDRAPVEEDLPC